MTLHKKPISFALWLGASLVTPAVGWATQVPAPQHTQQSNQCTGTITDEQGEPVIGATVQVKGTECQPWECAHLELHRHGFARSEMERTTD